MSLNSKYRFRNLTLLLTSCLTIMSAVTIAPSLPRMAEVFGHLPHADFLSRLVLTLPTFFIAVMAPSAGRFVDRHGRIRILLAAMVVYALAGASGFVLNDLYLILAGRVVLGLAIGVIMTVSITLIGDYFEGVERQKFIGIQVSFVTIGGVVFIGAGGLLADISWRAPFLIYLLALVLLPLALTQLPEPERHQPPENQVARMPRDRVLSLILFTTFTIWVLFFMVPVQIPFYVRELGVTKNSLIGLAIASSTASAAVSSLFFNRVKHRFSFPSTYAIGFIVMAAGFTGIWLSGTYTWTVLSLILSGLGMGWVIPNTTLWVIHRARPEFRGRAMGRLTTYRFMGQFLSPILAQPVVSMFKLGPTFGVAAAILIMLAIFYSIGFKE